MNSEKLDKIKEIFNGDKRNKIIIALGLIGVLLVFMSDFTGSTNSQKDTEQEKIRFDNGYIDVLESKTADILGSIYGVGKCKVMITINQSNENVYAKNVDENNQHGYYSENNEYVLYKDDNGETPILIKENYPKIEGVFVVCEGGDSVEIKEEIINAITSLFNVSSSHISISKLKQ